MSSMGKKKKGPALMTKVLKKKKLCKAKKKVPPVPPVPLIPGTKIVVETLSTSTKANVVWQDGSVEFGKFYKQSFLLYTISQWYQICFISIAFRYPIDTALSNSSLR